MLLIFCIVKFYFYFYCHYDENCNLFDHVDCRIYMLFFYVFFGFRKRMQGRFQRSFIRSNMS